MGVYRELNLIGLAAIGCLENVVAGMVDVDCGRGGIVRHIDLRASKVAGRNRLSIGRRG